MDQEQNFLLEILSKACFLEMEEVNGMSGVGKIGGEAAKHGIMDHLKACACFPNKRSNLYNISKEIKSIKERLHEISRMQEYCGIRDISKVARGWTSIGPNHRLMRLLPLRRTTSYQDKEHIVVGFEDEANTLLAELLREQPQRRFISIYVMGGLGKTTVAQKLYNSSQVRDRFNKQAWVCISQEYKIQDLLRNIIKSFKGFTKEVLDMLEKMTEEDLERILYEFLEHYRYLLVIDDVWDKEAWKILRKAFMDCNNGSRVIMTTCNKIVAVQVDEKTFVHELCFLRTEESWDLFCEKAFPGDEELGCNSLAKEELGMEMVGKCSGLPVAIIVLGGLLSYKMQLEEWNKVKGDICWQLKDDSIEISHLLSLSYNGLPCQITPSFLYLGIFPEDYEINAQKLMFLWIAEEFVPQDERRMEDVAVDYLNILVDCCLIQVTSNSPEEIFACRIHDLLRDLAVQEAREVIFFDIYDPHKYSAPLLSWPHAFHSHIGEYLNLVSHSNLKLRSLLIFGCYEEHTTLLEFVFGKFKLLRVLDLDRIMLDQLPDIIGELIHLKFLWLSYSCIEEFPFSIGNLKCLQFFEAHIDLTSKLPDEICKLKQLRYISGNLMGCFQVVKSLTNLQILYYVNFEQWLGIDSVKLVNLRNLWIYIWCCIKGENAHTLWTPSPN